MRLTELLYPEETHPSADGDPSKNYTTKNGDVVAGDRKIFISPDTPINYTLNINKEREIS